jgi:hypothetical protein
LATFPLGTADHRHDVPHDVFLEAAGNDLWFIEALNDEEVQDFIENLVVGKAVLVGLAWS